MKKKILFIIPNFANGGAEKNLVRIINHLDKTLYDIHIICFKKTGNNLTLLRPCVNIIDIQITRIYFSIFKISKIIKKLQPDIIFSWMGYVNAYLAFFIPFFNRKIKWLCRETSIPSLANKRQKFPWLFNFLYKNYNHYNLIICQSYHMLSDLANNFGVKQEKVRIINNGIDFNEINKNKTAEIIKSEPGKYKLLFVGGLRSEKRVEILIHVLSLLPENYFLTIVGSGDQYNNILTLTNFLQLGNRVEIITNCLNPVPYYQHSDCLLLCSQFEGFPNVVLEAFSCGCPAIGFNIIGGASEALENYGGFILENKSPGDFADKIISVCEYEKLDRNEIIRNCQAKYDMVKIISEYNLILQ